MARTLDVDDDRLELLDRLGRHHELVLQEPRRTVGPVPLSEHVERVVELRQVLDLAAVGAATSRYQSSPIGPNVYLLASPLGNTSGSVSSCGASNFSGFFRSFFGSWSSVASEPREMAARPSFGGALMASNQALEYV